jgi:serine protease Do
MPHFGEIAEQLRRSTVQVTAVDGSGSGSEGGRGSGSGSGSGVIWSADGLILTNAHVARGRAAQVELWDGRRFEARVTARDPRRDLAALRIQAAGLPSAAPGDSAAVRPGELVLAIGNPLGFAGALSTGVVHSIGSLPGMSGRQWIRANVRLAPGNSGGPLANVQGRVIGINTAILNGLGVAAPANAAAGFLAQGPRPALGVTLRPLPFGLEILELEAEGPAATASLRPGDILLGSYEQLNQALDSGRELLRLQFLRGGQQVREAVVRFPAPRAVAA